MPDTSEPLALPPESLGEAPGRGRLNGKKILVVGGGQITFDPKTDPVGNGRAMCQLFAREGAHVIVADINIESADETLAIITKEGNQGSSIQVDVLNENEIKNMFREVVESAGKLDGVVFNVGIFGQTGLDLPTDEWDRIMAANLRGALLTGREALDHLSPMSSIVMISSVAGFKAGSQMVAYDASKAGLLALMRNFAMEGGHRDIRCNMVVPGMVDTPNGRTAGAGRASRGKGEFLPFRRQTTGWEIANAALFFLSNDSVYITAQTLAVDSGITGL